MARRLFLFLQAIAVIATAAMLPGPVRAQSGLEPKREFRAAWVSTVANIDWPSSRELSTREQQAELIAILDRAVELNLNAIILQVRPMGDAMYASRLEPWSEFLTGTAGRAPQPFWDPLEFAVEECRRRGLELHAWFNPYRAKHPDARTRFSDRHISRTNSRNVHQYGRYLWMDPTAEEIKQHTLDVILDVVRRYDIDGVHIDDYFYPYPYYADGKEFPDDANWRAYRARGGTMGRGDWRRNHVNDFVRRLYSRVKSEDPKVKVGISPFGIWRPGHPEGTKGLDQYADLYADARLWLNEGWLDYISPQLYWRIDQRDQAYRPLLAWWAGENRRGRHLWPGNFTSRIEQNGGWRPEEIINQITATQRQRGATGNVHFSMVALMENRQGIADRLRNGPYAEPALIPPSPWLGRRRPSQPAVQAERDPDRREIHLSWRSASNDDVRVWALYTREDNRWKMQLIPAHRSRTHRMTLSDKNSLTEIAISAVDRLGNESRRSRHRVR